MNTPVNHDERLVLGLDIGSNSIGWALIALEDGKPKRFIDIGVRIFNRGVEDKVPTPKNAKRRLARLSRRVVQRRSRRRRRLESYLSKLQLLPAELKDYSQRERTLNALGDPYELRAKALDEELTPYELGRVFLHLVQRRGFLSNRKTAMGDLVDDPDVMEILDKEDQEDVTGLKTEEGQFKQQIASLREAIRTSKHRTLGEYLFKSKDLDSKRNRLRNGGDLRTDRAMYRQELHQIWEVQEKFHSLLNDDVREQIEEIIFFQRPLKLKADRVGKCSLEVRNKRCADARLEFQEFRYLQDVNNLSYLDPYTDKIAQLSVEQKNTLLPLFEKNKTVSYPKIRKILGFDKSYVFNLEAAENKKLKGNLTSLSIENVMPDWDQYEQEKKALLVEDLLSIKKKSALFKRLQTHWKFSAEQAISLSLLEFEEGHSNLSLKAIRKLLPFLRNGMRYDEARVAAGYGYEDKESKALDKLPAPPPIPNPIVNRGMSEVRKLVNAIIKTYGKPDILRVEMARDLEMNTKRYKQFTSRQNKNTKANQNAEEQWTEVAQANPHLKLRKYPSRDDKIKFRLWEDQDRLCAYSCRPISMTQLFSQDTETDHIIPYSFSLDDSYMNKVVCFAQENRNKSQQTPIDAFGRSGEKWDQITAALSRWDKSLHSKKERFYKRENEIDKDFQSSQLTDTRYIAREALSYLGLLGSDVTTTKGIMTSWLRHQWGLNSLISEVDEKDRSDHRQHAIDAAITACIDRPFYQTLVRLAKDIETSQAGLTMRDLHTDEPWSEFRDELQIRINTMMISHQTSSKIQGPLHEETGVGFVEGVGTVYRKDVSPDLNIQNVIDDTVREILQKHLDTYGDPKIAFGGEHPVYQRNGKTRIKRVRVRQSNTTRDRLNKNKFAIKDQHGQPFKWHSFGNIHAVKIFYDKETSRYETVIETVAEVKKKLFSKSQNSSEDDKELSFVLYKNDAVTVRVNNEERLFRVQKISFTSNCITLVKNHLAKSQRKDDSIQLSLSHKNILELKLQKVALNVLGRPSD